MLFTKKLKPPEGGQSTLPGTSNGGIATGASHPRNDRYIESRGGDLRQIYEHINYMQEALEIKFSELEKRLSAAEKRLTLPKDEAEEVSI